MYNGILLDPVVSVNFSVQVCCIKKKKKKKIRIIMLRIKCKDDVCVKLYSLPNGGLHSLIS